MTMFLNRCSILLKKVNVSASYLRPQPFVHFSSDGTSKDDEGNTETSEKEAAKKKEDSQAQQRERIKKLLSKLSTNSTLHIVREVQTAKPMSYKNIVKHQYRSNESKKSKKSKKTVDAVKAVATEIGTRKAVKDLYDSINSTEAASKSEDLDVIVAMMQTSKKFSKKSSETNTSNEIKDKNSTTKPRTQYMGRFGAPAREPLSKIINAESNDRRRESRMVSSNSVPVFGGAPLDIFEADKLVEQPDPLETWNQLEQHEYRLNTSYAPRNYFEKMAYWTDEGKIWKFPIDNEQGLDTEHQTPFTEHVFLEVLLDPWCPKKGAVRNFMELVCIGLSKNPYLTAREKHEHIDWYRNYFDEKSHILQGIVEQNESQIQESKPADTKSIE